MMKTYVPTLCYETLTAPSTCAHALPRAPHVASRGCTFAICACASPVSVHRWCCVIAAPLGACRLPPRPRPTWSSRLRHVDALLPCANPCARTSACLPCRHCVRSLCCENMTAPSTCAHIPYTNISSRNHAPLFDCLALSSCSPAPKSVRRLYLVCLARPPSPVHSCSSGIHRHQAALSTVICAHALPFLHALLRHAALVRHKFCLAMAPRGLTYPCPRLVDNILYRVLAASITKLR